MDMTTLIKKVKGRKTYYYAVRSARVNGKPRIVWQKYLGSLDSIIQRLEESDAPDPVETTLFEAGGVSALMQIAAKIGLVDIIDRVVPKRRQGPSLGQYMLLAALNRALDPLSKSQIGDWYNSTILRRLWNHKEEHFSSQRYWDHMDMISDEDVENIQRLVAEKVKAEFNIETETLLYDCTNFFTYIDTHNPRNGLAKRGNNKQKRNDLQQVNLALLTTKEFQIPLFHQTYRGDIPDIAHFPDIARSLLDKNKALSGKINDATLIFDKGHLSEDNRELLLHSGIHFVAGVKSEVIQDFFESPLESFQEAAFIPGTKFASSPIEISSRCCLAVVCYSESYFAEQYAAITLMMKKCEEKLRVLQKKIISSALGKKKGKRQNTKSVRASVNKILSPQHMKKIFSIDLKDYDGQPVLKYSIDHKTLERIAERELGRTLLITTRIEEWLPSEVILAYRSLYSVEEAFRHMKNRDYLRWQPSFHWTDQKLRVHTLYCVLALLLATLARKQAVEAGYDISLTALLDDLSAIKEVVLLYRKDTGKIDARFTVNSMTTRQKKLADLFNIGEILAHG
jgi:transposase